VYDPATGAFSATGSLATPRLDHAATLLNNGKVLITAGDGNSGGLASAELYDPLTGAFSATGNLTTPRQSHTATLLNGGRVLISGGVGSGGCKCGGVRFGHWRFHFHRQHGRSAVPSYGDAAE